MQQEPGNRKQETGNARGKNPRWLWITAFVIGGVCAIAFVVMWFAPVEESVPGPTQVHGPAQVHATQVSPRSGAGFGAGMIMGLAAGIAIGFAIARQRSRESKP